MADISTEINDIQSAVYGEEVRSSIISAIEKINDVADAAEEAAENAQDSAAASATSAASSATEAASSATAAAASAEAAEESATAAAASLNDLTWDMIKTIVKTGIAEQMFNIGDQIVTTYTYNGTEYEMPWDIVHFGEVETEDGETVPGMWLQSHYATIESIQFDNYEAFYYAEDGLSAGTYNITFGETYGNYVSAGDTWQFTLTEDVPAGGVLCGFYMLAYAGGSTASVYSYADLTDSSPIETVTATEGSDGTSLGTAYTAIGDTINSECSLMYGNNKWSRSGYRAWLNSDADAGEWFEPADNYDRAPDGIDTYAGFMQGLPEDFLNAVGKIKVTTLLNTALESDTYEETYDTFFPPSLEQIYCEPYSSSYSGYEGDYWEYWQQVTGASSPQPWGASYTYSERITYGLNAHSSARSVRLRSVDRYNSTSGFIVFSSGVVYSSDVRYAYRCAPACVIC